MAYSLILVLVGSSFLPWKMNPDSINTTLLWQQGKKAALQGSYANALQIWESAKTMSDSIRQEKADARIGRDYIALVTREHLRDYYIKASEMYLWGISNCANQNIDVLRDEYERVEPILNERESKQWRKLVKKEPEVFCNNLVKFWDKLDPTITTDYNERLIEHWERIAYAQEHFKRGRSTIYNADDRALIYIKYGNPDRISKGILQFNYSQVQAWIRDVLDFQFHDSGFSIPVSSDTATVKRQMIAQIQARFAKVAYYTQLAQLAHKNPYYEIWVYKSLLPTTGEHLIYIFGDDGDTGEFEMQRSLEDMIPHSAFRGGFANNDPLTAGLLLQLLFYEQASIADNYFASTYNDLQSRLLSPSGFHRYTSFEVKSQFEHRLSFLQFKAPREKSTYFEKMPNINLVVYQYRLIDEHNRPYLATFLKSQPQKVFFLDLINQSNELNDNANSYELFNYSMVVDSKDNILDKQHKPAPIFYQGTGNVENMRKSVAYFRIPSLDDKTEEVFTVELLNKKKLAGVGDGAFMNDVRGIGKVNEHQPEPLLTDIEGLEMGDLIVGIQNEQSTVYEKGPTSFNVTHDHIIPEGKNLMVHLEVYHLEDQDAATNKFEVNYKVSSLSRNLIRRIFGGRDEKVGLTLNFETTQSTFKEDLEIATSPFKPGSYRLTLQVIEPTTNREIKREVDFKIKETP